MRNDQKVPQIPVPISSEIRKIQQVLRSRERIFGDHIGSKAPVCIRQLNGLPSPSVFLEPQKQFGQALVDQRFETKHVAHRKMFGECCPALLMDIRRGGGEGGVGGGQEVVEEGILVEFLRVGMDVEEELRIPDMHFVWRNADDGALCSYE